MREGSGRPQGTTQGTKPMQGAEGAAFSPIKLKINLAFRYAKQGRRLENGSETENRTQETG